MASHLFSRPSSVKFASRNRLRKVLLESLERRELMAADLLSFGELGAPVSYTLAGQASQPLAFQATGDLSGMSPDEVTTYLDSTFGSSSGDITSRAWFPLIQESYSKWSQQNGLAYTFETSLTAEGEGGLVAEGEAGGPRLLSIAPNSGNIFSFNSVNTITEAPTELIFRFDGASGLNANTIANGIKLIRAGRDGAFGDANDQVITPGFLGFGDTDKVVKMRFNATLPDDLYRVVVIGADNAALNETAIRNVQVPPKTLDTRAFDSTPTDRTRDTVDFKLELGAQIVAVVPQPVDRSASSTVTLAASGGSFSLRVYQGDTTSNAATSAIGLTLVGNATRTSATYDRATNRITVNLATGATVNDVAKAIVNTGLAGDFGVTSVVGGANVVNATDLGARSLPLTNWAVDARRDIIRVYFNEDDFAATAIKTSDFTAGPIPSIVDTQFYKLLADRGTVSNLTDASYSPSEVEYYPAKNLAVLKFSSNLDEIDPSRDTSFRLRIGTNEAQPSAPETPVAPLTEPASTFAGANKFLGTFSSTLVSSKELTETIQNSAVFPLDFPGAPDTPGVREVNTENKFQLDNADADAGVRIQRYNFNKTIPYGTNSFGQPLLNSITEEQMKRAREVFEFYGAMLGIKFIETPDFQNNSWTIVTGPLDALGTASGPGNELGVAGSRSPLLGPDNTFGRPTAIMDSSESWNDEFGQSDNPAKPSWFEVAMHEIGHLLGLGHSTDLPLGSIMAGRIEDTNSGASNYGTGNPVEPVYPGPTDTVSAQYLFRPDSRDIDMYQFIVPAGGAGVFSAEIVAERRANSVANSALDSLLTLYREFTDSSGNTRREVIAVNDNYFSKDSFIQLKLQPGTYYLGVSASGNATYNPEIQESGLGGTSEGAYQLRTTFRPLVSSSIVDASQTPLDGDSDGQSGGVFDFWFNAAAPNGENTLGQRRALFVDKTPPTDTSKPLGSRENPYRTIRDAFANALPGDIVRILPNGGVDGLVGTAGDNFAFEVGRGGLGNGILSDGETMDVPKGVTLMIDAGVLMKMGASAIGVGSSTSSTDASRAALQVLGTPGNSVLFTSYTDESLGVDTSTLITSPRPGDWGGIIFRNAIDRADGRFDDELNGRFVNYVGFADMKYGGGRVNVNGTPVEISPVQMVSARPTLTFNKITLSAGAAIGADPDSFEETNFSTARYQGDGRFTPDYNRVGPEIHGNTILNNSINGLLVGTPANAANKKQTVSARWDDTDITYVLTDVYSIQSTPGGAYEETAAVAPNLAVSQISGGGTVLNGTLATGQVYSYRMTFMDANGFENVASPATQGFTLTSGNSIRLDNLPPATTNFVARRLYRSVNGGTFQLVTELDRSSTFFVDSQPVRGTVLNTSNSIARPRLDGSLVIDPGMVIKLSAAGLIAEASSQIIAEGTADHPIVFTSRNDDRYGAAGTFDTNNDGAATRPAAGDWGGVYFGQYSKGSLNHVELRYGGGILSVGATAGFNAVEIHQASVRIANSLIENNANGLGGAARANRAGYGFNEGAAIFIRGAQPIIVNNIVQNNVDAAFSINPASLSGKTIRDPGSSRGQTDALSNITENKGPLFRGNKLDNNNINGLLVRGETIATESIWDDTDIVHVLQDEIIVPDFYVFGGIRLQSSPNESLVAKFSRNAGITSTGRPLDIDDRIGGTLQVVGTPGFPVVMTSLEDCTIGAGFTPSGASQNDTHNSGLCNAAEVPFADVIVVMDDSASMGFAQQFSAQLIANIDAALQASGVGDDPAQPNRYGLVAFGGTTPNFFNPDPQIVPLGGGLFGTPANYAAGINTLQAGGAVEDGYQAIHFAMDNYTYRPNAAKFMILVTNEDRDIVDNTKNFTNTLSRLTSNGVTFDSIVSADFRTSTGVSALGMDSGRNAYIADGSGGYTSSPNGLVTAFDTTVPDYVNLTFAAGGISGDIDQIQAGGNIATSFSNLLVNTIVVQAGASPGTPGDWRSIKIDQYSNDRNVDIATELEPAQSTGAGINGIPSRAQNLGQLAANEKAGDENQRLGFTLIGAINNPDDLDVYSFTATAGTQVWLDIDRTDSSLDSVVELVDSSGNIIALSNDSFYEARGTDELGRVTSVFANPTAISANRVNSMPLDPYAPRNFGNSINNTYSDFYSTNPLDAGLRVVLPGASGTVLTYFVRVRSSNVDSRDPSPKAQLDAQLRDPANLSKGKTEGQYQLQLRLREMDEIAGSTVRNADIRFSTNGVEVIGMPAHSPVTGEAVELETAQTQGINDAVVNALNLGNFGNTDRAALSLAGELTSATDVDWYRFDINQDAIQDPGLNQHLSTIIDVDYADGFARANTSLWLFYQPQGSSQIRLVNMGTDSNIADDVGKPTLGTDVSDLSRGSAGLLDAFIGSQELPAGTYFLALTSNQIVSSYLDQFYRRDAGGNQLVRVEPVDSVQRLVEARFNGATQTTANGPSQVVFNGNTNSVPSTLATVPFFVLNTVGTQGQFRSVNAMTGAVQGGQGGFVAMSDFTARADGTLIAAQGPNGAQTDALTGAIFRIDPVTGAATSVGTSGIQTYELDRSANPPTAAIAFNGNTGGRTGVGMQFYGLSYQQTGTDLSLYAVGSRGQGNPATFLGLGVNTDARNYVYRLDPSTFTATSAPQPDRDPGVLGSILSGAGTQIRERAYINTNRDIIPNTTSQTINVFDATSVLGTTPNLQDGDRVTFLDSNGVQRQFIWQAQNTSLSLVADTVTLARQQLQQQTIFADPTNFYRDGMSFTLNDAVGNSTLLEFDTGPVLTTTFDPSKFATYEGARITIRDTRGPANTVIFEFDVTGGVPALVGTTPVVGIPIDANTTRDGLNIAIRNAINNLPNPAITQLAINQTANGGNPAVNTWNARATLLPATVRTPAGTSFTNRISLTNEALVSTEAGTGAANRAETAANRLPVLIDQAFLNTAPTIITPAIRNGYDGATFTVTDKDLDQITFEFDTNGAVTGSTPASPRVTVNIAGVTSRAQMTTAIINAINNIPSTVLLDLPGRDYFARAVQQGTSDMIVFNDGNLSPFASDLTVSLGGPLKLAGGKTTDPATGVASGTAGGVLTSSDYDGTSVAPTIIRVEEFFTNLGDFPTPPTPQTPSAMTPILAAIRGVTGFAAASAIGTRISLPVNTTADATQASAMLYRGITAVPPAQRLPFQFTDTQATLQTTLLTRIQTVEPNARMIGSLNPTNTQQILLPNPARFNAALTDDRNEGRNMVLSSPITISDTTVQGVVSGIAFIGSSMFAVDNQGQLFKVGVVNPATGLTGAFDGTSTNNVGDYISTIYDDSGNRVVFTGLTSGPLNAESGAFANTLFGVDRNGVVYAFDTGGNPRAAFADANWFVSTGINGGGIVPSGLTFSNIDSNLWHVSGNRANDAGHGVEIAGDGSRTGRTQGGNSLYFGFAGSSNAYFNNYTGVRDPNAHPNSAFNPNYNSYNVLGGASGKVDSNPIDLRGYSAGDKPTLYFNYYIDTQDKNSGPGTTGPMLDSLRVYVSGDDGVWRLMATNNSAFDGDRNNGNDEYDYLARGTNSELQVAELYDANEIFNGQVAPDSWRQARIDLSAFAGQELVRIRYSFDTGGTSKSGFFPLNTTTGARVPRAGGVELQSVPGTDITDGQTFTIETYSNAGFVTSTNTFEFTMGLVLQIPSGARLSNNQQFTVDGVTYTFSPVGGGNNVQFAATDSAEVIAARIVTLLNARGLNATVDPTAPGRISVLGATSTAVNPSASLPVNFVAALPGVNAGTPVFVNKAMDYVQVREAIRVAMARAFNPVALQNDTSGIRFHDRSIYLFNKRVIDRGPLGYNESLAGDEFGTAISPNAIGGSEIQRWSSNDFEGVYIDDIIVGFAERGEMVTGTAANVTGFSPNPKHEPDTTISENETGTYQIEIRRGASYGVTQNFPGLSLDPLAGARTFDTNDRLSQQYSLVAPTGSAIADGQQFTLSDGVNTVTFEFDDTSILTGPSAGVAQGNVRIPYTSQDAPDVIARSIRDAINGSQAQAIFEKRVLAGMSDGTNTGAFFVGHRSTSRIVNLYGAVAVNNQGGVNFFGTAAPVAVTTTNLDRVSTQAMSDQVGFIMHGLDNFSIDDLGDSNRFRDQGQVIVQGNIIRDTSDYGIVVDAGIRGGGAFTPLAGALPHPGAVRNLFQFNQANITTGVVVMNNLIYGSTTGGIQFSGDTRSNNTQLAPVPFGRIVNNTIVGPGGAGIGINVTDNAAPTLLNNIVASLDTGIRVDASSLARTVLSGNTFQTSTNTRNFGGSLTNVGAFAQTLSAAQALFLDATNRKYYLATGSLAIDSSVDQIQDRPDLTTVRDPLGISRSPIIAPLVDVTGQLRADDPLVNTPPGLGGNVFKDRGAIDRSDFDGPVAFIQVPLDNDPDFLDEDRNNTYIQLQSGVLNQFSILLLESSGTGPDADSVSSKSVTLTENGRLLLPGVDYVFGYSANSRTIRLTPIAGIWRSDSVYEITLNNANTHRVSLSGNLQFRDKDTVTVVVGTNTYVLEIDDGSPASVTAGNIAVPVKAGWTNYQVATQIASVLNGLGVKTNFLSESNFEIHGATSVTSSIASLSPELIKPIVDLAGNALAPNRATSLTQFTIAMPDVSFDFGDAPGAGAFTLFANDGARHALLPVDASQLFLGSTVSADANGIPSTSLTGDDNAARVTLGTLGSVGGIVRQGNEGPAVVAVPNASALDGQTIFIDDGASRTILFEFDTNNIQSNPTAVRIPLAGELAAAVATKLATAVNNAVKRGDITGLIAVAQGTEVSLGGSLLHSFTFSNALPRVLVGNVVLSVPSVGSLAANQSMAISDGQGNLSIFVLNPSVALPSNGQAILVPTLGTTATAADVAAAIARAINEQIGAGKLALPQVTSSGSTVRVLTNDEDGVSFGALFNAGSNPVPINVTASGAGLLDGWIDWNGDGDFNDTGENIIRSQPVAGGLNIFNVQTPSNTPTGGPLFIPGVLREGYVSSRFRVSALGSLLVGGAAVGGEVEDYLIEIVGGTPPLAVTDNYTVAEDTPFSATLVGPIFGVLNNDSDADGDSIRVRDENPLTPAIDPFKAPSHARSFVLRSDGTFDYQPEQDFYGTDTFVYYAMDARLSRPATVTITVTPVNDAPVAFDDTLPASGQILEDSVILVPGSTITANDWKHTLNNPNEDVQKLTLIGAQLISTVSTDLGFPGLRIKLVAKPGQPYGVRLNFLPSADLGPAGAPTVAVVGNEVNVRLNKAKPSTAADLIAALNSGASALLTASLEAGSGSTPIGVPFSPLVVPSNAFVDFGIPGLKVDLIARPGQSDVNLQFLPAANLGATALPTVSVTGNAISVTLNSAKPSTVADFMAAIAGNPAANALLATNLVSGASSAAINTATAFPAVRVRANLSTDFGINGVRFELTSKPGQAGATVSFQPSADLGIAGLPLVSVVGSQVSITLNKTKPSTIADLMAAISGNAAADALLSTNLVTGASSTAIGDSTKPLPTQLIPASTGATASTNFGVVGLNVTIAAQPGKAESTIRFLPSADLGPAGMPTVTVAGNQISVTLNSSKPSTVADFIAAISGNTAANALVSVSLTSGLNTTPIGNPATTYAPIAVPAAGAAVSVVNGDLQVTPPANYNNLINGPLLIEVTIQDDIQANAPFTVAAPVPAGLTAKSTVTINLTAVNDKPQFTLDQSNLALQEDNGAVTGNLPFLIPAFAKNILAGPSGALDETTLPGRQNMNFVTVSVTNQAMFAVAPSISATTGDLTFVSNPDANGVSVVVVELQDSGANATTNGDLNTSDRQTFTITLNPINDAPDIAIQTSVTRREDFGLVSVTNFATGLVPGPATAVDEAGQQLTVRVRAFDPTAFSTQPSIAADGTLTYATAADINSNSGKDLRVEVFVEDDGTASPAPNSNQSSKKIFTIIATPVNDAPVFTLPTTNIAVREDDEAFLGVPNMVFDGFATNIRQAAGMLVSPPNGPTAMDEANQVLRFDILSVSAPELFDTQPTISPTGQLTFHTAANKNGKAVVVVRLIEPFEASSPAPNSNTSANQTFTIAIDPINDAPLFEIPPTITVAEGTGLFSQNSFATQVRRGPAGADDENSQQIDFIVNALTPDVFIVKPTIGVDGTLTFQLGPDVNVLNADLRVTVQLQDFGTGSPAPNNRFSVVKTFLINATPTNDPPIPNAFSRVIDEDQTITIAATDVLNGDVAGPLDEQSDGTTISITQIERTTARGGTVVPTFSGNNIVSFQYIPAQNFAGTDTFLYIVTDTGSPARSATGTITITVTPINDAPEFVKGADREVPEDSPLITLPNWATGILPGPANALDELNSQTVTFVTTVDKTALFEVQPSVASNGTLTFKPAGNANGVAVVTVTAFDNGVPVAQSQPQQFTITISPVNDAPVFTAGPVVTVQEDSGAYSQPWASQIAAAAGLLQSPPTASDESTQIVDFSLTIDKPSLFSVLPTIDSSGRLRFTPSRDSFGTALITVRAVDRGPSGALDQNTSAPQVLTITITPANDTPVAVADSVNANENSILNLAAPGLLANDTDVDLPNDVLTVISGNINSALGAKVTINSDGSISYDPSAVTSIQQLTTGQSVQDTFVYKIKDAQDAESIAATVTVNVAGVNDAPTAVNDSYTLDVGQSRLLDVLINDTDIDTQINAATISITSLPAFGTVVVNQTGVIEYTPGGGFRGVDTFRYTVRDTAGNVSNEALVTVTVNNRPTANPDTAFTSKNQAVDINVLANDTDVDGTLNPSSVQIVVAPTPSGTATVLPNGSIRFVPENNFSGTVSLSYVVSDDIGTVSNVATVDIRVQRSRWQNSRLALDVNDDKTISPIDALLIINRLNDPTFVRDLTQSNFVPPPYLDVNGDEVVGPVDALLVINYLNSVRNGAGEGEGEGESNLSATTYAMMVTPQQMIATVGTQVVEEIQSELNAALLSQTSDSSADAPAGVSFSSWLDDDNEDDLVEGLACSSDEKYEKVVDAFDSYFETIGPYLN